MAGTWYQIRPTFEQPMEGAVGGLSWLVHLSILLITWPSSNLDNERIRTEPAHVHYKRLLTNIVVQQTDYSPVIDHLDSLAVKALKNREYER